MEFKKVKISELGEVVGGATPSTKDVSNYDGNISWITPKDLAGYNKMFIDKGERNITEKGYNSTSTRLLPKNSILFTSRAPIGYIAIAAKEVCTNQGFKSIIPNKNTNYMFLYYLLKYNKDYIASFGSGTTFKEVSGNVMKNIEVVIPTKLKDQIKISNILYSIDEKIELNNQINDNLQEISSNLYRHYFVDSDDYEYEEIKLSEIASEVVTGKTPSTSKDEYWGGNIPFVTIPDMHNDVFTINAERYLTEEGNNSQKKKLLPKNSIMVSCIATVGLVSINSSPSHTNQQINSIIIKNDYDLYFLYENMKTRVDELKGIGSSGTSTLNVNKGEFEKLIIKYPTKEVLLDFDKNVRPLFNKMEALQKENKTLEQLRDTLLPKLMNGEIDLENIEI